MKIFQATIIGLAFTITSYLISFTLIIPIFIFLPLSLFLEWFYSGFFEKTPYDSIGISILLTLFILFLLITLLYIIYLIKSKKNNQPFIYGFLIGYFFLITPIIHPLYFYYDISDYWDRINDGQVLLGVSETFKTSSLGYFFLGALFDLIRFKWKILSKPYHDLLN